MSSDRQRLSALTDAACRRQCRAVFFGRTSAGKSTAINALVGRPLLPTALGSTTSCFVEVRAAAGRKEPVLMVPIPEEEEEAREGKEEPRMKMMELGIG